MKKNKCIILGNQDIDNYIIILSPIYQEDSFQEYRDAWYSLYNFTSKFSKRKWRVINRNVNIKIVDKTYRLMNCLLKNKCGTANLLECDKFNVSAESLEKFIIKANLEISKGNIPNGIFSSRFINNNYSFSQTFVTKNK